MKGRVGSRPGLAGKLLAAGAAMLCAGFLTSTSAAADTGRIAVTTTTLDNRFHPVLELVDPTSGGAQLFAGTPGGPHSLSWPTWNKDASVIAYYEGGQSPFGVWVKPVAGGPEYQLLPNTDTRPSWSPTADEIAYWHQTQTPTGQLLETLRVTTGDGLLTRTIAGPYDPLVAMPGVGPEQPAWSPDGKSIAFAYRGGIVSTPATGGPFTQLVAGGPGFVVGEPSYAPDGARLAYVKAFDNGMGQTNRFQLIVNGQAPSPAVTSAPRVGGGPEIVITEQEETSWELGPQAWSPDSKQLAYSTDHCTAPGIENCDAILHVANANGSGDSAILHRLGFAAPAWEPVTVGPNYYIKHIEVAQALGPPLPALDPTNAEAEDPIPFKWSVPSYAGFPIPLIAGRRTLLRIYVGDAKLDPGEIATRTIHYSVTAGGTTLEGDETVEVTAPDRLPDQKAGVAAIKAWIPAADSLGGAIPHVEVNIGSGQDETECAGCDQKGNRASVDGIAFEPGGDLTLASVPINLIQAGQIVPPSSAYHSVWSDVENYLPIREGGVSLAKSPFSLVFTTTELKSHVVFDNDACEFLLGQLMMLRKTSTAPATERWVGIATAPPLDCSGLSLQPSNTLLILHPRAEDLAHELGHSLGLDHTLSLNGRPPDGEALPYVGIGVVGYQGDDPRVRDPFHVSDLMGYDKHPTWTSPATWWRMHQGILGGVGVKSSASSRRASASGGRAAAGEPRRLVSGYLARKRGRIFSSLLANVTSPNDSGPIAGRLVALDGSGQVIAKAKVTGTAPNQGGPKRLPFVVALPPAPNAVSLELRKPGGRRLATLERSRHAPSARFIRLRHRARANKPLTVRWKATDKDDDSLSVTLLARRRGAWRPITLGPAAFHARVKPKTLGRGKKLRLRLLVSDDFNTTTVKARPVRLR